MMRPASRPMTPVKSTSIGTSLMARLSARNGRTVIQGVMTRPNRMPTSEKMNEVASSGSASASAVSTPTRAPTNAKMTIPTMREAKSDDMLSFSWVWCRSAANKNEGTVSGCAAARVWFPGDERSMTG